MRHETLLRRASATLIVVDVQERLLPVMTDAETLIANCRRLIKAAKLLDVPVQVCEQYPKGLGATVQPLAEVLGDFTPIEKLHFSACGHPPFRKRIEDHQREQILLCGIEAHVCVLQTALDLIAGGWQVHLAADAISSRATANISNAIERMRHAGVIITNTESALFEMLEQSGGEPFKAVSKLVR